MLRDFLQKLLNQYSHWFPQWGRQLYSDKGPLNFIRARHARPALGFSSCVCKHLLNDIDTLFSYDSKVKIKIVWTKPCSVRIILIMWTIYYKIISYYIYRNPNHINCAMWASEHWALSSKSLNVVNLHQTLMRALIQSSLINNQKGYNF